MFVAAGLTTPGCGLLASLFAPQPDTGVKEQCQGESCAAVDASIADSGAGDTSRPDAAAGDDIRGADRAVLPDAAATGPTWWLPQYRYRARLALTAQATDVPAGYPLRFAIDHKALVQQGKSRQDGNDLRLCHWNGTTWSELPRVAADRSQWNDEKTTVMLKAAVRIPTGVVDLDYYVYYGNPAATDPPTTGVPSARYYLKEMTTQRATPDENNCLSVADLLFTPADEAEHWVVVATWRQADLGASDNLEAFLGRSQIKVNGAVLPGRDEITFRQAAQSWKSFGTFFVITGVTGEQQVTLEFAAHGSANDDAIDNVRLLAFLIPNGASADVQHEEEPMLATDDDHAVVLDMRFTPASEGNYLWFAAGLHHEGPGSDGSVLSVFDEDGQIAQRSSETYIQRDNGFVPLVQFGQRSLAASPTALRIDHDPATDNVSERQGLVALAFRSDAFDKVYHAWQRVEVETCATEYQQVLDLATEQTAIEHDTVLLAAVGVHKNSNDEDVYL
ncbi:MAG: hypothetical protein JXR83_20795, partial [Deltaproteobacteria bacterium]|nr:hypothetical protein [Deltaproteobacteria bacterium]